MNLKYIILLTLAVASNGMSRTSLRSGTQVGCSPRSFRCEDGKCIPNVSVCDLYDDCEDGSDENNCKNHVCSFYEFQCQSGQCIYDEGRCDGFPHCADNSDETNCDECSSTNSIKNRFKCVSNDKCIPPYKLCDSIKDCPDGSDEDQETCQNNTFSIIWPDYTTEKSNHSFTECPSGSFKCETGNKCIWNSRLCDTVPDCEDGSDESDSTCSVLRCGPREFQCQSGQCLDNYFHQTVVCNGRYDCKYESDKSDETNCTICSSEALKCDSGECVHKLDFCNLKVDCSDGSDENKINCPNGSTPQILTSLWRERWLTQKPNVTLQHLTEDLAVYFDNSVSPNVTWPFSLLSLAWKYAKETFEFETFSEPGSQFLYVVLGKSKKRYQNNFSFRSRKSGYRNIIDPGLRKRNGWATENSANLEKLVSGLGYIVKTAMEGVKNNADENLCDNTLRSIVFYDIYIHLKGQESADVKQWKDIQFNQTLSLGKYDCFRDWFLPVYEHHGGSTVLKNYFQIFKTNWPNKLGVYSEFTAYGDAQLNVGEFVHFWSGAAGEDLRFLAKSAFHNWDKILIRQFAQAQTDFPNITYPGTI